MFQIVFFEKSFVTCARDQMIGTEVAAVVAALPISQMEKSLVGRLQCALRKD